MTSYVPAEMRRAVVKRAGNVCEYCLLPEEYTFLGCQVDHVIAEKHGGETSLENLSLACTYCYRFKGTDIGSIATSNQEFTRFFNPRIDNWLDHFRFENLQIIPTTPIGETTVTILKMNTIERQMEREMWQMTGFEWPPKA